MNNTIENLERYYKAFIDQQDNWAFFLGLAYYVAFILEAPETKIIADLLTRERISGENKIKKLGKELLKEVMPVKEILLKRIKDAKISYAGLTYEINDFEDFELRKAVSSDPLPATLADCLNDIIWSLSQNGYKELIKDFITEKNGIVYVDKHKFSERFREYEKERQQYADKEKIALWGFWGYICFAYVAVLRADVELAELKKDKANWFRAFNLSGYFGEMKKISEGEVNDIIEFKKEKYKSYAVIIHNHLIKELSKQISLEEEKRPVELFTNEVVPDRTAEIERQMNETRKWEAERMEREKLHKEQMKQDRILRTLSDKYTHALDLIIERAEYAEDGNGFSIEFYDFNFEKMIGSKMLEKFLTEMQKDGCFENYTRTNYVGGTQFGFIKPSIEKLKAFKEKRAKITEPNKQALETKEGKQKQDIQIKRINYLITRDKQTGEFYYKKKPIKFTGKNTIYFWIFECLYEKGDLEGFYSYESIDKYLIEHGEEECEDRRQMIDRIKNGITNLFRFSNIPQKTPSNKSVIQKTRGEGLTLYNPSP